ncbi:MAG: U32 family peptidase [Mediterranea sp.]|jgi:putative protease|nr:U32 family peptidase [Mediterranea sp.]
MTTPRKIELLSPAKNLTCGIEAINHGADAVYIGAPKFSARAAAGNTLSDIAALVAHAHLYNARVYVALNTILYDHELAETEALIWQLYHVGIDALIIQDMGITGLRLPPLPLHASTQMDNRTVEKVRFLADAGFRQVVLARELSLDEIRAIHQASPSTALEVFVHGALCVSYSGQCYISQACFGRSANRGECAQFCRLPFTLTDTNGEVMIENKHLLSLKDLNLSDRLEELLDAGVTSLKIEGRLKEVSYVKNITATYRRKLDALFERRPEYTRASSGRCTYTFNPQADKSFNRGFTGYFLNGRQADIGSPDSPKSVGEAMGCIKRVDKECVVLSPDTGKAFHNGDGACFVDRKGNLTGFRINRVEGRKLYLNEPMTLNRHGMLYRNYDHEFEQLLARPSSTRKIAVSFTLAETPWCYTLTAVDEDRNRITQAFIYPKEEARTPQADHLRMQLGKLGNTPFELISLSFELQGNRFIPASVIADWRRQLIDRLLLLRRVNRKQEIAFVQPTAHAFPLSGKGNCELTYLGNVANRQAVSFYRMHGVDTVNPSYEQQPVREAVLMYCKHCIRFTMGMCPKHQRGHDVRHEPYYLVSSDGKRFRLEFDCKNCVMKVYKT